MPVLKAQVQFERASGLPADRVINTFAFGVTVAGATDAATLGEIATALQQFYDTTYAATGKLSSYLSPSLRTGVPTIDATQRTIRIYNLADAKPRVPVAEVVDNPLIGGAGTALPDEVAFVLSFQAQKVSGTPQARRRGRIYLGPLNTLASGGEVTGPRPSLNLKTVAKAALADLAAKSAASVNWTWGVYSEKFGTFAPVHDGWVDNAFDTQRRRGLAPTTKETVAANAANGVVLAA